MTTVELFDNVGVLNFTTVLVQRMENMIYLHLSSFIIPYRIKLN